MAGVAREQRFPERAWRGATATDVSELQAWMLARHSRRHAEELGVWISAIAEWKPPPALSHHKLRWFRSVLVRYGPPSRRWELEPEPDNAWRRLVKAVQSARARRQNDRKRDPAPPRVGPSHPHATHTTHTTRRHGSQSHARTTTPKPDTPTDAATGVPPTPPARRSQPAPLHW
jgi:hypothetical protein